MESKYEAKIEELMQENHKLRFQIEEYKNKENWYKEELQQLEQGSSQDEMKKLDEEFKARELELKEKISCLRLSLDVAQQAEKQHQDRIAELEKVVVENQLCSRDLNMTKVDCNETMGVQKEEEFAQLHEEICTLKAQIRSEKTEAFDLKMDVDRLKNLVTGNEEEIQSLKMECSSYCNLLEKSRAENTELTAQLDILVLQNEQQTHEKKGNSLFSELDDRRVEAETILMSKKKSFDAMKKKNEVLKQHNQKLKMQLFGVMGKGDNESERVKVLETQIEQERGEKKALMEKLQQLEESKASEKLLDRLEDFSQKVTNEKGVDKDYIDYLVQMLKSKEEEVQDLSRKLHIQRMCLLDQRNKVTEKERLLYAAEVKKDEMWRKCQQLKLEKDELEIELKPELKSLKKPVGKTEKIPTGLENFEEKNVSILRENTSENEHRPANKQWALDMMKQWEEEDKKKMSTRRSVRMSDDVDVYDEDGQMNTMALRGDENDTKLERKKPSAGKVTVITNRASEPKHKVDDCKTQ